MKLKQVISKIIKSDVDNMGWDEAFKRASQRGDLDQKNLMEILKALCKHIDPYIPDLMPKTVAVNEQVSVFNPLAKDFTVSFDIIGNGSPMQFTARSQEITTFDPVVGRHMIKHLVNKVLEQKNVRYPTAEDIKTAIEEITVKPQI